MKKPLIFSFVLLLALLSSCSGSDNGGGIDLPEEKNEIFYGKLLLGGNSIADDAKCSLYILGDSASVTLYSVSFVPAMPAMNIVIPGLKCSKNGEGYVISGKNIVPTVNGMPMDKYRMSSVDASLADGKFVLNTVTSMGSIGFSNADVDIKPVVGDKSYKGELISGNFAKEVVIDVTTDEASEVVNVVLNDVKFAQNMPLIDITLKGVPYVMEYGKMVFGAENIAPYMNSEVEPVQAFMFAFAQGTVIGNRLQFSARMADNLAAYVAGMEFAFEGEEVVK